MAEHRIVVPGVVGSSPISHPSDFKTGRSEGVRFFYLILLCVHYNSVFSTTDRDKNRL